MAKFYEIKPDGSKIEIKFPPMTDEQREQINLRIFGRKYPIVNELTEADAPTP